MRKILIFYASYGGGHFSAAKALKEYIDENENDVNTQIVDFMKYISRPIEASTTTAYREFSQKIPELYRKFYFGAEKGFLFNLSKGNSELMSIKLNRLIQRELPDIIISTHPLSSQMCSFLKKKGQISSVLATAITDFGLHNQWLMGHDDIDHFFIATDEMKKEMIEYGVDKEKIHVTGIPVSARFFQHFDRPKICRDFGLDPGEKTMLFFGGGQFGLSGSRPLRILKAFAEQLPRYQIVAVAGKNKKIERKLKELAKNAIFKERMKVLGFTDQVPELMSIASFVISKPGGLTTAESLASGIPMIAVHPIPGQEEKNAEFLEKNHVGLWMKSVGTDKEIVAFILVMEHQLEEMKANAENFSKENPVKKLCEILFK